MLQVYGCPNTRSTRVVWVLDEGGRPQRVTIGTGADDAAATEVVAGPLREGQRVIVGATVAEEGRSLFGLSLRL